jgi:gluconokinase
MLAQTCTIGIDIGTTSVKVLALSEHGGCLAEERERIELIHTEDGGAEQDVKSVYHTVTQVLAQVMERLRKSGIHVQQVGFSSAMHSILAIDSKGTPLTNAITWLDLRAKNIAKELWESGEGKTIYLNTGTPIHSMSPLVKLAWLKQTNPTLFQRAHKFVSIKEWIWYQWFREWVIDESMASATGLYNTKTAVWDTQALKWLDLSSNRFSQIVPTTYVMNCHHSKVLKNLGFQEDTVFNIGATDGVLANLGVGALEPDHMVLTIGTSCAVRVTSVEPKTDLSSRSFCYVLDKNHFVLGGPSNSGGIAVERLFHQILGGISKEGLPLEFDEMLEAAGHVETGDLLCLPYVAGERAPLWDPDAKAAWIGIGMEHSKVHLLRSVVEGVLLNAYWIAKHLMDLVGTPKYIMTSGSLQSQPWIRQATADIFGVPVYHMPEGDSSAIGAARLAEIANGKRDWNDLVPNSQTLEVVQPNPANHAKYQQKFKHFRHYAVMFNTRS